MHAFQSLIYSSIQNFKHLLAVQCIQVGFHISKEFKIGNIHKHYKIDHCTNVVEVRRENTTRLYNGIKDGCHWGFSSNTLMLCKLILSISKYLSDDCLINEFRSRDIQIVCVNMQLESTCNLTLSIRVYRHATCVDMQHI